MIVRRTTSVSVFLSILFALGCEGEPGSTGVDRLGDDLQPPNVELVLPAARQAIFEDAVLEVHVIDDGEVDRVEYLIDGAFRDSSLIATEPPWNVVWDSRSVSLGAHFLQASAWDKTGKQGFSSMVMVFKADSSEKPARDTIRFYDPTSEGDIVWTLPDSLGRFGGYGTRFTLNRPGRLLKLRTLLYRREGWSGIELKFEIKSSVQGEPDSLIYDVVLETQKLRMLNPPFVWQNLKLPDSLLVPREFFVLVSLAEEITGDTVGVMTDNGRWRNWHGVVKEGGEWREFSFSGQYAYNPLMWVDIGH